MCGEFSTYANLNNSGDIYFQTGKDTIKDLILKWAQAKHLILDHYYIVPHPFKSLTHPKLAK